jgi:diguanylate cyclase (GGDEF)-like protein
MNGSKKISALSVALIIQLVLMIVLSTIMTATITKTTKKNAIEHMQTITDERASIILNYVENAEKTLTYFSEGYEVKKLLERQNALGQSTDILSDSGSSELIAAAQAYTETFSGEIDNLEGLWIGSWETHCLAHTNPETVGMTTRPKATKEKELKQLQDAMLEAGDKVYNTGIILSPASAEQVQIVSMYKAVYNDAGEPIGFVGLGIKTEQLINKLNSLSIKGIENSSYSMVNVNDGRYVFNDDKELMYKPAENQDIQEICAKYAGTKQAEDGDFEYKKDGKKYVSIYSYIPEYGWLLMLDDTREEVYSLTYDLRVYMIIFAIILIGLMIVFSFITRKQQKVSQKLASTIVKNNKTKESLYTAMFKDVLTDVNNRISFSMDADEMKVSSDSPYFFAMFNIADFSGVNSQYGNDIGDWLLVRTVDQLKQSVRGGKIYRTGSDEFVIAIKGDNKSVTKESVMDMVNEAMDKLNSKQSTPVGKHTFEFKAAIVKKSTKINGSVITALKDMVNKYNGQVGYADIDGK